MITEQSPTIKVSDELKAKLDRYKIIKDESYNSVISRMLDKCLLFDRKFKKVN